MGFLGYHRALLVADDGVQGGHDANAVLDHLVAVFLVDGDTEDALFGKGLDDIPQPSEALEEALCDDRLHHVELQLAGFGGKAHGGVVADDLEADLVGYLGDDGVHLAGHDG